MPNLTEEELAAYMRMQGSDNSMAQDGQNESQMIQENYNRHSLSPLDSPTPKSKNQTDLFFTSIPCAAPKVIVFPEYKFLGPTDPTSDDRNPLNRLTRKVDWETEIFKPEIAVHPGNFRKASFSRAQVTRGFDKHQIQLALDTHADFIIPFAGGPASFMKHNGENGTAQDHASFITNQLKSAYPGRTEDIHISQTATLPIKYFDRQELANKKPYGAPFIHLMINIDPELRDQLRRLQSFAPNELATFHYIHHDDVGPSWVYLQLVSENTIKPSELERQKAYMAIMKSLWSDQKWCRKAETALMRRKDPYTGTKDSSTPEDLQSFFPRRNIQAIQA
jgi:hypothetical protein